MSDDSTERPVGLERKARTTIIVGAALLLAGIALAVSDDEYGRWLAVAGIVALIAFYPITLILMEDVVRSVQFEIWGSMRQITVWHLYGTAVVGMVLTGFLVWITEYYTGTQFKPVRHIAAASRPC